MALLAGIYSKISLVTLHSVRYCNIELRLVESCSTVMVNFKKPTAVILSAGIAIVFFVLGCNVSFEHEPRSITGPGLMDTLHTMHHGMVYSHPTASGDSTFSQSDSYVVSGRLSATDTRPHRSEFDQFFCDHLPPQSHLDSIEVYSMTFYAQCSITNNVTLKQHPKLFDHHTIGEDKLRSYLLHYGTLVQVKEVYYWQNYAEVTEENYHIYCLSDSTVEIKGFR